MLSCLPRFNQYCSTFCFLAYLKFLCPYFSLREQFFLTNYCHPSSTCLLTTRIYRSTGNIAVSSTGWPTPQVSWFRQDELLDDLVDSVYDGQVSNTLLLMGVSREHFGATFECRATTSPSFTALRATVTLDIYRKYFVMHVTQIIFIG